MGKNSVKREFIPATRTVNGLFILFKSKESIYVEDMKTGMKICCQRWFETTPGFYSECWKKFAWALKYTNDLTTPQIGILAARYGVTIQHAEKIPDIPEGAVLIPERRKR